MSKSILVKETPKNCSECHSWIAASRDNPHHCIETLKVINEPYKIKAAHCPLQDTTELLEALDLLKDNWWSFYDFNDKEAYNKLYKALGGENND